MKVKAQPYNKDHHETEMQCVQGMRVFNELPKLRQAMGAARGKVWELIVGELRDSRRPVGRAKLDASTV
jgi:hypothetical protein